jgi:ribose 5-phosphate isomerase B
MKIYFAGDHAGFEIKAKLIEFVRSLGHEAEDMGPFSYDAGDDYPDFVIPLAIRVAEATPLNPPSKEGGEEIRGIVVAGSGQGEIIAMNRIKGARAALLCPGTQMIPLIKASRDHNDSNIFSIGARFCTEDEAKRGITVWFETPFSGDERHIRRLRKIEALTK